MVRELNQDHSPAGTTRYIKVACHGQHQKGVDMGCGMVYGWLLDCFVGIDMSKYWTGVVEGKDDFGITIDDIFIDGKTNRGPWAIMTPRSFRKYGVGLGTGLGQKYKRQSDGRWLKIEG